MTNKLIILFILTFSMIKSFGQFKAVDPIEFRCNDRLYSIRYGVWSDPIQNCNKAKYNFYSNTVNFNDIPKQDSLIIEGIKENIKIRGGQEFYSKLIFQNILISQRPKKCDQRKYTLRIIFPIDSIFYHRFSLTYDLKGHLISEDQFPEYSKNNDILKIIDYCSAIDIALSDTIFKKAYDDPGTTRSRKNKETEKWETIESISMIKLSYNKVRNLWVWKIYSETKIDPKIKKYRGNYVGKVISINAKESSVISIEEYRESKTECF